MLSPWTPAAGTVLPRCLYIRSQVGDRAITAPVLINLTLWLCPYLASHSVLPSAIRLLHDDAHERSDAAKELAAVKKLLQQGKGVIE